MEKIGLGSKEARLAWEVVDDLENPSSGITAMLPKPLDEECDITTDACQEYQTKMAQLENLLKEQQGSFAKMRKLAEEVKGEVWVFFGGFLTLRS